ncbi:MAG: uracil-DNA glycosylase [Bacillota bacterium]
MWAEINDIVELERRVKQCQRCGLRAGCNGVVFGEGNSRARLMLVGEAPGAVEDETGRPFVGPAGQLLEKILAAIGLSRQDVYIANVVKCRPPGNRLPTPEEAATCYPHLKAQLRLIKPSVVVCLGALSTQVLVDPSARITKVRGQWVEKDGIMYMPTYHPAALLRDPSKKLPVWEDFKEVRRVLLQLQQEGTT